jgi:hypothetical protein
MAKLVGVFNTAHSPFCYMPPEQWNQVRASRKLREDVPMDDVEENKRKSQRIQDAFKVLRDKMEEVKPDVILIYGDDQYECFDFSNFPAFAVYVGEDFEGNLSARDTSLFAQRMAGGNGERPAMPRGHLKGHPEIATAILTGVMKRGFDPAFSMDMPKPEHGIGHAILRPAESLTDMNTPIVPLLLNCYYAPQPTAMRCYEFGKAVRQAIEEHPSDLRVVAVGSGGLWHTPGNEGAWLDEDFDRNELKFLEVGDAKGMAEYFDAYKIPGQDASQDIHERSRQQTGMPGFGGPQGGTREICNWIAAAGMAEGSRSTIVDYVPVYSSPIGAAFSYCTDL